MFRKRRSIREGAPSNGEAALPAAPPSMPPPPPPVNTIVVGPQGATRHWLTSLLSTRPELRLLGTYAHCDQAAAALKHSAGRRPGAVLVDARLRDPHETRSAIRMMREWFPTLRIVAYGDDLDEIAVEGLYFVGADAVLSTLMEEEEVITAILMRTLDAAVPKIPDPEIAVAKEALQADSDIVRVEERAEVMGETTEAIQEPALGMDEPPPAVEEPTPAPEEPTPAMEESQHQEETSPPPRRPPLLRSLGLLRSGRDHAGR